MSERPRLLLVTEASAGAGGLGLAAAIAVGSAIAEPDRGAILAEFETEPRRRRSTLLSAQAAVDAEDSLCAAGLAAAARGQICHLALPADDGGLTMLGEALPAHPSPAALVAHLPQALWLSALDRANPGADAAIVCAPDSASRVLASLAVAEIRRRGLVARVVTFRLPRVAARRAQAGLSPGRGAERVSRLILGLRGHPSRPAGRPAGRESGQALPAILGICALALLTAMALAAIGGAVAGKARAQRAADLVALSAARSMRDDLPRLLAPALLTDGRPNPASLARAEFLARAEAAGVEAARRNGVGRGRVRIAFPGASLAGPGSSIPLRARAVLRAELTGPSSPPDQVTVSAVAETSAPAPSWTGLDGVASGGGYSGPLVYRNGEGMRPDVGAAFDQLATAARGAGLTLVVSSGFRSDREQAALFAAHPDPRWVAPPGRSLHRCATELDLGPAAAYPWLAANAPRFGFLQRYSWEAWHYGFERGPAPCSAAAEAPAAARGGDGAGSAESLPAYVPARFRAALVRSAARWNVSPGLLAAQLQAESGFNPNATSPAGALGIAQFIPATAAAYGLRDPFDPEAAIDAQAHLMSDLLGRFDSIPLALAAYNAGPGAVEECGCVPRYPETQAYVTRILATLGGSGAAPPPPLQVRLVR